MLKVGEHVDKEVGDEVYRIRPLPFRAARRGMRRLANLGGGALRKGSAGALSVEGLASGEASLSNLDGVFGALLEDLGDNDLDYFHDAFRAVCQVRVGEPAEDRWISLAQGDSADRHFEGRPLQWMRWIGACLEVTYADFFDAAGPLLRSMLAVAAARAAEGLSSSSPTGSTSTSTASSPPVDTPPLATSESSTAGP